MLRGAAPVNGRAARPTVTRAGLVPVEEPEWSSRSPRAEIRVTDGIQENSTNASKSEPTNEPLTEEWRRLFFDLTEPATNTSLRIASQFIDVPQRGGALARPTSLSALIGQGSNWPAPFWAGFRPGQEPAPPRV